MPAALKEWAHPRRPARRGRPVLQARSRRGQEAPGRGGHPERLPGHASDFTTYGSTVLVDQLPARPQEPEGRGHRRQAEQQGVRGLHLDHLLRQVRRRWPSAPRPRSSIPTTSSTASTIPGETKNHGHINDPVRRRHARAPAAHHGRGQAARDHLTRSSATSPSSSTTCRCRPASTSRSGTAPLKNYAPQPGLRLRRAPHGRLARPVADGKENRPWISRLRSLTRRDVLKLGGAAAAVGAAASVLDLGGPRRRRPRRPSAAARFRLRSHVPPVHFDPHQTIAFSTMIPLSFAYSRLVKVKGGSAVVPGTQPVEGDLAESWERPGRHRLRLQAPEGRALAQQAPGQRPRADRRGRAATPTTASSPSRATATGSSSRWWTRSRRSTSTP